MHSQLASEPEIIPNMEKMKTKMSSPGDMMKDRGTMQEVADCCHCAVEELDDLYPCTPLQEGMMATTFKESAAYTVEYTYQLPSDVEARRFREAWKNVAQANPILRTRIVSTAQHGCVQVVVRRNPPWQMQSPQQTQQHGNAVSWEMGAPLVRFTLKSDPSGYEFQVLIHHALCEDWSMALLLHQVEAAYRGELLTPRPFRPFIEYIGMQRPKADEYWTEMFKSADQSEMKTFPCLPRPGYQPRPATTMYHTMALAPGHDTSFSLNTKMRLSWAILQSLHTGTVDTLFGSIDSGRGMAVPGIESVSGPTLACIPVHIVLNPDDRVVDALKAVRAQWLREMEFGQIGLQNLLHLGPGPAAACKFLTLLAVEPREKHSAPRMFATKREVQKVYDTYPFILRCRDSSQGVTIEAHFDPVVITDRQTERVFQQLENIYQQVNKAPETTLREINILSSQDESNLIELNLPIPPPASQTLHDLIHDRVEMWPEAPAISSWDGDMTYKALDDMSSAIAAQLVTRGIRPRTHVAVCVEKGKWMPIAMLSVMKAGAAFVLLDPSHPPARLKQIWRQLDAQFIITSKAHSERVSEVPGQAFHIDTETRKFTPVPGMDLPLVMPVDPVYVTFTSGSTGTPKGAISHHGGFASSALAHGRLYGFTQESRVLQFASPAFDSCIIEQLTTLIFGGCVCIPTAGDCHSSLSNAINTFGVNVACLTPTVARILSPESLPTLRSLIFVGEAVIAADVKQWQQFVNVRNAYGPAECSAVFSVQPNLQSCDASNIGFSTGCVGWIVHPDDHEILMPVGCIGELVIEGPTVGRGYLRNPKQTAEAFITAPSWRQRLGGNGGIMYKTGDLVQYAKNDDGSICYLGRKGTQVKFHGQRIEMADIEYHLRSAFPDSQQVVAEMLPTKEPLLVAFIYLPDNSSPSSGNKGKVFYNEPSNDFRLQSSAAQDRLANSLPPFMIPRLFLPVAHIPLTASSKTDRRALREHAASLSWNELQDYRASSGTPHRGSTPNEAVLQNIWAQILNRKPEEMGVNENFFRLGGDSVSAMQISASCQSAGFKLTVANIMEFPTIAELSEIMQVCSNQSAISLQPGTDEEQSGEWFDLSPIQQLFFEKMPEGHNGFTQQFMLRLSESINASKIQQAMELVVREHSMLRACFKRSSDGRWRQSIRKATEETFMFRHHPIPSPESHALRAILEESQRAMDIQSGRVLAVDLIITPKEQYLSVMAHHLVIDLVSWRVLLQDLEDVLTTGSIGGLPSLPFLQWCRMQKLYSKECLDPSTSIPTDIPSPPSEYWGTSVSTKPNTWGETNHESISISEDATRAILSSCNDAFHTRPVEIIHAAIIRAFSDVFDNRVAPTVFSEGHGREPWDSEIDISRTIGWYTTMVPFFVDANRGQPVADLLVQVKERRRSMPSNGWEYFASRYHHVDGSKYCQSHEPMEILFNYTGLFQQLERSDALLQLATLPDHDLVPIPADLSRFALIDISATVMEGRLLISFWYNKHMEHAEKLNQWIHECTKVLEKLPATLQQTGHFTLSDFPLLSIKEEADLQRLIGHINNTCKFPQSNIEDIYQLSPIQLGMWLSQLKSPDMYWSHMEWFIRPSSALVAIDLTKCRSAWQSVVDRHPILRTVFTESLDGSGQPVQVVLRKVTAAIHTENATDFEKDVTSSNAEEEWIGKAPHRIFLQIQPDGSVLCKLSIHHMLVDGATRTLILSDFREAYDDRLTDKPGSPYSSFLTYLREKDSSGSLKYWRQYLQGAHPCTFPSLESVDIGQETLHSVPLRFPFSQSLQKFCQQRGITVSNLFQIAWGLVLRAYTGSDAVCFGFLASGRDIALQDAHCIAGPMMNLLICRLTLNEDAKIKSILVENQSAYARSLGNQHFGLADVVHSLGLSDQPLFNTAMSLQWEKYDPEATKGHGTKLDFVGGRDHTEVCQGKITCTGLTTLLTDCSIPSPSIWRLVARTFMAT
jgi:amino acid adenylation domain-containing protein/non-ribosomal peptide synthase protein (TIGR01720 family)